MLAREVLVLFCTTVSAYAQFSPFVNSAAGMQINTYPNFAYGDSLSPTFNQLVQRTGINADEDAYERRDGLYDASGAGGRWPAARPRRQNRRPTNNKYFSYKPHVYGGESDAGSPNKHAAQNDYINNLNNNADSYNKEVRKRKDTPAYARPLKKSSSSDADHQSISNLIDYSEHRPKSHKKRKQIYSTSNDNDDSYQTTTEASETTSTTEYYSDDQSSPSSSTDSSSNNHSRSGPSKVYELQDSDVIKSYGFLTKGYGISRRNKQKHRALKTYGYDNKGYGYMNVPPSDYSTGSEKSYSYKNRGDGKIRQIGYKSKRTYSYASKGAGSSAHTVLVGQKPDSTEYGKVEVETISKRKYGFENKGVGTHVNDGKKERKSYGYSNNGYGFELRPVVTYQKVVYASAPKPYTNKPAPHRKYKVVDDQLAYRSGENDRSSALQRGETEQVVSIDVPVESTSGSADNDLISKSALLASDINFSNVTWTSSSETTTASTFSL